MNLLRLYFFLQVVLGHPLLLAQNLVPNGSFEDYKNCPGSYSLSPSGFEAISWKAISTGSPDYFNTCSEGEAAVPYNWAGVSEPYDGYGYTGIYTWMNTDNNYREYLHCKLIEPLVRDSIYQIKFHYKLSSYSKFSTDRIGFLISDSLKFFSHDHTLDITPTVSFIQDSALTVNTGTWEIASAEYHAKGNEQYLTIGNFFTNEQTKSYYIRFRPESQPMLGSSAYYYIDDVSVKAKFHNNLIDVTDPVEFPREEPILNTIYVLKNIQFEFNSYTLMSVSFEDLDHIVNYLRQHRQVKVSLSGHTDEVGSREYNRGLSTRRAESTAAYLVRKGIQRSRISTCGYGETKPLANREGKMSNRRVEIEFRQ